MKRRSLAILLSLSMAVCPISVSAADYDLNLQNEDEIIIVDEGIESESEPEDEIIENLNESADEVLGESDSEEGIEIISDEENDISSDDSSMPEEDDVYSEVESDEFDLSEYLNSFKLNYRHYEGEENFQSVTEGVSDSEYNVVRDKVYPSKYVNPNLPKLRNQNPYGSCWAHATIALAEISLMNKGLVSNENLSELHLAYFVYNSVTDPLGGTAGDSNTLSPGAGYSFLDIGGNVDFALHTLETWQGAAAESTAPYSSAQTAISKGLSKSIAYEDQAHVENYYKDHYEVNGEVNINAIKEMITRNGAAAVSYYHTNDSNVYNEKNNCYYNPGYYPGGGHSVAIVGWDDNFSRDKFSTKPAGNGAWLIRNSWYDPAYAQFGLKEYSLVGYFWMSYYEGTMQDEVYAADFNFDDNYVNNYQYDGSMTGMGHYGYKFANVFTAAGSGTSEAVSAVSFATENSNLQYQVRIYTGLTDEDDPESGTLETTVDGSTDFAGYYTVKLPEDVYVKKGEKFSVVIEGTGSDKDLEIEVENTWQTDTWFNCVASAEEGQSFIEYGFGWQDLADYGGNARIRAFSYDPENVPTVKITGEDALVKGNTYNYKAEVISTDSKKRSIVFSSSNKNVVTIDSKTGKAKAVGVGTATITASARAFSASIEVTCYPKQPVATYKVGNDNSVVISWKSTGAQFYYVEADGKDISGKILPVKSGKCSFTDDTFKGKELSSDKIIEYKVFASENGYKNSVDLSVKLNRSYKITYVLNGGTNSPSNPEIFFSYSKTITLKSATKEGYVFAGWYSDRACQEKVTKIKKGTSDNVTIYAGWTPCKYSIKFNGRGASSGSMSNMTKVEYDKEFTLKPNKFKKKGYEFESWNTQKDGSGTSYSDEAIVKENLGNKNGQVVTLYAQWKKVTYSITYELDGGINSADNPEKYEVDTKTIKLSKPTKAGYVFNGWYKTKTEDGKYKGKVTKIAKGSAGNLTLHAKFTEIRYTVKFNGNKATSGTMDSMVKVSAAENVALNANEFTKDGYVFKGWNTRKNGSGIAISDKAVLFAPEFITKNGQTVTLYAQWE